MILRFWIFLIKAKGTAPFTYKWYKAANATDVGTLVRTEANTNNDEDSYTPEVTTIENRLLLCSGK